MVDVEYCVVKKLLKFAEELPSLRVCVDEVGDGDSKFVTKRSSPSVEASNNSRKIRKVRRSQSKITTYFDSSGDDSYKLWNGPLGYDKTIKRANMYKHMPHENILCKFAEDCKFNLRDLDERTIYNLNRHFVEDHRVDMENQIEQLEDIFTGFSKTYKQRFLQCGYCLVYIIYGFKRHMRGEWDSNLYPEPWWCDNCELSTFNYSSFQLNFSTANDLFSECFHEEGLSVLREAFLMSNCDVRLKENVVWHNSEVKPGGDITEFYVLSSISLREAYSGSCHDLDERIYGHISSKLFI